MSREQHRPIVGQRVCKVPFDGRTPTWKTLAAIDGNHIQLIEDTGEVDTREWSGPQCSITSLELIPGEAGCPEDKDPPPIREEVSKFEGGRVWRTLLGEEIGAIAVGNKVTWIPGESAKCRQRRNRMGTRDFSIMSLGMDSKKARQIENDLLNEVKGAR
jgi:hypothetical protein